MNIEQWFQTITGGETQRAVAKKINVQQSKLSRQIASGKLDPEIIRDIARAYGHKAGDALLETGFLVSEDLTLVGVEEALGYAKNSQLWAELSKRSDPEARRLFRGEGKPGVIDLDDDTIAPENDAQVFDFPTLDQEDEFEPERYVAKRKRPEPAEGDDDYGSGA